MNFPSQNTERHTCIPLVTYIYITIIMIIRMKRITKTAIMHLIILHLKMKIIIMITKIKETLKIMKVQAMQPRFKLFRQHQNLTKISISIMKIIIRKRLSMRIMRLFITMRILRYQTNTLIIRRIKLINLRI